MNPATKTTCLGIGKAVFALFAALNALWGLWTAFVVVIFHDNLNPLKLWGYVIFALMALYGVTSIGVFVLWLRRQDMRSAAWVLATAGLFALSQLIWGWSGVRGLIH